MASYNSPTGAGDNGGDPDPGRPEPGGQHPGTDAAGRRGGSVGRGGSGGGEPVPRSRMGGLWIAIAAFALILLVLLVFILQNSRSVEIRFLGWGAQLPLGVALLLAAVGGALLVALAGTVRIIQLRLLAGRRRPAP